MGNIRERIPVTIQALAAVFALMFAISASIPTVLAMIARMPPRASRLDVVGIYLVASLINGVCAAIGFLPGYALLRWRPSELSRRKQLLWPAVSGAVSGILLSTNLTSYLVGRFIGPLLPPAHFGMVDLFVSVAIASCVITLVLKLPDLYIRSSETREAQNA